MIFDFARKSNPAPVKSARKIFGKSVFASCQAAGSTADSGPLNF